jgi:hypothetical protein
MCYAKIKIDVQECTKKNAQQHAKDLSKKSSANLNKNVGLPIAVKPVVKTVY